MLVLYIVVGIVGFFILSLLIPINFTFSFKTEGETSTSLRANWLFGLVERDLHKRARKEGQQKTTKRTWHRLRQIGTDLKTLSALMKLVRRLFRALSVKRLSGYLKLGFDNPADTGIAFGVIQPLFTCLSLPASASFRIEPDFSTSIFKVEVEGSLRVYPLKVAGIVLGFVCSAEGRRVVRRLARTR